MSSASHPVRGILAGALAGLFASWVMNEFMAGPGTALARAVTPPSPAASTPAASTPPASTKGQSAPEQEQPDATMVAADKLTALATGGQHLTWEQEQQGGPIVHYAFGALMGGLYGGLAEYSATARSGFGTTFGSALFAGGDLLAVPALHLSKPLTDYPPASYISPFAAHLVYGATTELTRRLLRRLL